MPMPNPCCCGCPLFEDNFTRTDETINDSPATDSTGDWVCKGITTPLTKWKIQDNCLTLDVPSGLSSSFNEPFARHRENTFQRAVSFDWKMWFNAPGAVILFQITMNINTTSFFRCYAEFTAAEEGAECGSMRILTYDGGGLPTVQVGHEVPVPGLDAEKWHRGGMCIDFDLTLCSIHCTPEDESQCSHHSFDMPVETASSGLTARTDFFIKPDRSTEGLYQFDNVNIGLLKGHDVDASNPECPCCRPKTCQQIALIFFEIEIQTVEITGDPNDGTYTLSWNDGVLDYTTDPLAWDATQQEVEDALRAIPGLELITVRTSGDSPNVLHAITFWDVVAPAELTSDNDLIGTAPAIIHDTILDYDGVLDCRWNQEAGSWTQADGIVSTTDASAILLWYGSWSGISFDCDNDPSTRVVAKVMADAYAAEIDVILDWLDSSNYHYARVKLESAGGAGNGTLKIFSSTGGELASITDTTLTKDTWLTVSFCYDGYVFIANHDNSSLEIEDTAFGGLQCGVGSGTVTATTSIQSVTISHNLLDEDCEACESPMTDCASCEGGKMPDFGVLRIRGITGDCSAINGTYVLKTSLGILVGCGGGCCWAWTQVFPFPAGYSCNFCVCLENSPDVEDNWILRLSLFCGCGDMIFDGPPHPFLESGLIDCTELHDNLTPNATAIPPAYDPDAFAGAEISFLAGH